MNGQLPESSAFAESFSPDTYWSDVCADMDGAVIALGVILSILDFEFSIGLSPIFLLDCIIYLYLP